MTERTNNTRRWRPVAAALILALPISANAGKWIKHDNFDQGSVPDPKKWSLDQSSANITIENKQMKFETFAGVADDSASAKANLSKKRARKTRGLRADVKVASCDGDVRGRIGSYVGNQGSKKRVWTALQTRSYFDRIDSFLGFESLDFSKFSDVFSFSNPNDIGVIGKTFKFEMMWTDKEVVYKVNKAKGNAIYEFKKPLKPVNMSDGVHKFLASIGTRGADQGMTPPGVCVVYFDNVELYQQ